MGGQPWLHGVAVLLAQDQVHAWCVELAELSVAWEALTLG